MRRILTILVLFLFSISNILAKENVFSYSYSEKTLTEDYKNTKALVVDIDLLSRLLSDDQFTSVGLPLIDGVFLDVSLHEFSILSEDHSLIIETANGQKAQENSYINDKLEGVFTSWYENGLKQKVMNYIDNKLEGIFTSWYESGELKFEFNCKNGLRNGESHMWYENGQLDRYENCIDDKVDGETEYWKENGELIFRGYRKAE